MTTHDTCTGMRYSASLDFPFPWLRDHTCLLIHLDINIYIVYLHIQITKLWIVTSVAIHINIVKVLITQYVTFLHNGYNIGTTIVTVYNNNNKHIHQTPRFLAVWGLLEQADLMDQVPWVERTHHCWPLGVSFR